MKDTQLEKMNVKELRDLGNRVETAINARLSRDRSELREKMIAMAQEAGLSLSDVVGSGRKGKGKGSVAVKYRHPDDDTMTWTGRGRRPKWLENVSNIEKFRV